MVSEMDFNARVKIKYPYLTSEDIFEIVEKAKMFYYALKFPCEPYVSEEERPIDTFVAQRWILSACDELIDRLGFSSAVAYKENGVSWSFDNAELSDRLVSLIKPTIGVI